MTQFLPISGTIQQINWHSTDPQQLGCMLNLSIFSREHGPANLLLSGYTYVPDGAPLSVGDEVTFFYSASAPFPLFTHLSTRLWRQCLHHLAPLLPWIPLRSILKPDSFQIRMIPCVSMFLTALSWSFPMASLLEAHSPESCCWCFTASLPTASLLRHLRSALLFSAHETHIDSLHFFR